MKHKKGFIFIETIVVLTVVVVSLSMVLSTYALVSRKSKLKYYYDRPSDIYLLYNISKLGTVENSNYVGSKVISGTSKNNCTSTAMNTFLGSTCSTVLSDNNLYLFIVMNKNLNDFMTENISQLDNATIEYLTHLDNQYPYVVGVFRRDNKNYFASIKLEGI